MQKGKIEIGAIRPIYNISGFQVCKTSSDNEEEIEWIPVEKISDAEMLSFIFQQKKSISKNVEEEVLEEVPDIEPAKSKKKNGKSKSGKTKKQIEAEIKKINKELEEIKEAKESDIDDEDL